MGALGKDAHGEITVGIWPKSYNLRGSLGGTSGGFIAETEI